MLEYVCSESMVQAHAPAGFLLLSMTWRAPWQALHILASANTHSRSSTCSKFSSSSTFLTPGLVTVFTVDPGPAGSVPERWQQGYVFSVRSQPGGPLLAAACSDGSLRTWMYEGGRLTPGRRLDCHQAIGSCVAFTGDGTCLASVAKSGEVVLWVRATMSTRSVIRAQ